MTDKTLLILDAEAAFYARELAAAFPDLTFLPATTEAEALPLAPRAVALIALAPRITPRLLEAAPHLAWVHALTTGVDNLLAMPAMRGKALTKCNGIHGPQMSELAILLMMASARRFDRVVSNQQAARWERWPQPLLLGKTLCIVGLGAIAQTLAGIAGAFGLRVTGVSDGRREVQGFAAVHPRADLPKAAAEADFLVVLVPHSPQTHHLINAAVLAAMKPTAHLINIARGGCVDEAALLAALDAGRLAGAALDVFATEPLPADSRFWTHPRVIVTPHIGGYSDTYHQQALPAVARAVAEWAQGGTAALSHRQDRK